MALLNIPFEESTTQNRSKTVTIKNLRNIRNITVDTGTATYMKDGENLTVHVRDGVYTRTSASTYQPSKQVTDYRTTPPGGTPYSLYYEIQYNDGTYSGTLQATGAAYQVSGSAPLTSSREAVSSQSGSVTARYEWSGSSWVEVARWYTPETMSYTDSEGRTGTLTAGTASVDPPVPSSNGTFIKGETTTRTANGIVYYSGTISKTTEDTRVYRRDYAGTVYAPSDTYTTYYYAYNVTVEYESNIGVLSFQTKSGKISIPVYEPTNTMPLRTTIKGGKIVSLDTVATTDPSASPLRVNTKQGIRAITKL